MPELPEVETIRQVIESQIRGCVIRKVLIERPEIIACPQADVFCRSLEGQSFLHMSRRGKFLIFHLSGQSRLILHLRMTGNLLAVPHGYPAEKHTHAIFLLDNGCELRFSDTRRFGRFWMVREDEADTYSGIEKLGIEPFDARLDGAYLQTHLGGRKKTIKECLLEQSTVAGIGNIYSDEILFTARILPMRAANTLTKEEWQRLAAVIPERLAYFIDKNAITPEDYLKGGGKDYRNTPFLQVYGHAGEPCPSCGHPLVKTVIGGRSSVYCPSCQKDSTT